MGSTSLPSLVLTAPMPHKHNADRRHHIPKMPFKVQNCPADRGCHRRGGPEPNAGGRTPGLCPRPANHRIAAWGWGHLALHAPSAPTPTATYRKVTGGFRSDWGADLFAAVRSVIGTAKRRGIDAYQAIRNTLQGQSALAPG